MFIVSRLPLLLLPCLASLIAVYGANAGASEVSRSAADNPSANVDMLAHRSSNPDRLLSSVALGTNQHHGPAEKHFYELADEYLKNLFVFEPSYATQLGIHDFDGTLEDVSEEERRKENAFNKAYLERFNTIDSEKMSLPARDDLALVKNHIEGLLFESEVLQGWKKNPDNYSSFVSSTLFPLIKRDFAPLDDRLKSVIAREKKMPKVLADAEKNIDPASVPRIYAELAEEQLPGIIDFFKSDVPQAVKAAKSAELKTEFEASNRDVVDALLSYQKFVKGLLTDKKACRGEYALGAEHFRRLLSLHEMVDEPLDSLLAKGITELKRLQFKFRDTARSINPNASQAELFDLISEYHPQADKLVQSVKDVLGRIRSYIVDKKIVTIPGADNLIVEDTPPFLRATTFAAMDAPGPFETTAKEAFFFVTLPESGWDKEHVEEHMRAYTFPDLLSTSIHEAYPGHYVQALWNKQLSTNVRRAFDCSSNAEGWAHYCEQMMLDEGFDQGDKQLRLIQIHDALLRGCRYVVAIKMHTQGMSVTEAADFFMKEGFQEKANAEREAKRGTVDPTYLVYTLGKLEILSLRDQVKKAQGDDFNLQKFHDTFLSIGGPPLKIVRAELLSKYGMK